MNYENSLTEKNGQMAITPISTISTTPHVSQFDTESRPTSPDCGSGTVVCADTQWNKRGTDFFSHDATSRYLWQRPGSRNRPGSKHVHQPASREANLG